ncbi:AfsR/SARP family transcriptional regulator [Kribbella amoyensis]|uniref:AfsR/SARP family transcriptional regulator n=1 Tax=Kribbella amoyensis TaxID=996641 RepID=UPI00147917DF|nr:BTAD domain-containing putative transcriptional regulator [Kribbella amoyensis]
MIRLLGGVSVQVDDRPAELRGDRLRSLLALLALAAGSSVSKSSLVERIWGESPPADASHSLHTLISRLRRAIGADLISTAPTGYTLLVVPDQVDVLRFAGLQRVAAQMGDRETELTLLTEALELWTGRPFEGLAPSWFESVALPPLVEQYLLAVERRLELRDDPDRRGTEDPSGRIGADLAELRELTTAYPLRESLWVRLLRLLARSGRTAEALELYESVRQRIAEELGVDPGAELRAVHAELLAGETPVPAPSVKPPVAPSQLPADVPGFCGRKQALAELDRMTAAHGPESVVTLVLHGPGGVGKTSLAVHWSHQAAAEFPDGTLFVDLGGYGPGEPVEPSVALGYLLHALGVPAGQIPAEVDGRSALFRSTLAGRRILLVLDNARSAEQVRPLLPGRGAVVLITSRSRLRGLVAREGARQLPVDQLSEADARTLLTDRIGPPVTTEAKLLDQLAHSCNHLPLALVIAAEQVAHRSGSALAELVEELDEYQLDAFETDEDVATDLRAVFSWSYRALEPEAARLFRILSLYPERRFGPPAVAALAGLDERTVTKLLRRLTDLHLVVESGPNRFQLHDLLRAYAGERFGELDDPREAERAWERLLDWAIQTVLAARQVLGEPRRLDYLDDPLPTTVPLRFEDQAAARAWFDLELRGLMAMVVGGAARGLYASAGRLGLQLWVHLSRLVSPDESISIQRIAVDCGRRVGNRKLEALAYNQLGTSYGARGDLDRAEPELRRALATFEAIDSEVGIALVRGNLGYLLQLRGQLDEAIEQQQLALQSTRRMGDDHASAAKLNNLAMTYIEAGRYADAKRTALECVDLSRDLTDKRSLCYVNDTLGQAYVGLGEVAAAADRYETSVRLNLEIGNIAPAAATLLRLGQARFDDGDDRAAAGAWQRALDLIDAHNLSTMSSLRDEIAGHLTTLTG